MRIPLLIRAGREDAMVTAQAVVPWGAQPSAKPGLLGASKDACDAKDDGIRGALKTSSSLEADFQSKRVWCPAPVGHQDAAQPLDLFASCSLVFVGKFIFGVSIGCRGESWVICLLFLFNLLFLCLV